LTIYGFIIKNPVHGEIYQGKKIKMAPTLVTEMAIEWYN